MIYGFLVVFLKMIWLNYHKSRTDMKKIRPITNIIEEFDRIFNVDVRSGKIAD